jgi:hypothetical protein
VVDHGFWSFGVNAFEKLQKLQWIGLLRHANANSCCSDVRYFFMSG